MIGCRLKNSDLHIFLKSEEINLSEAGKVVGTFINLGSPNVRGVLEALVDDSIGDLITTSAKVDDKKNITYLDLRFKKRIHERLVSRGSYEFHEGYRHISLIDVERPELEDSLHLVSYRYLLDSITPDSKI